MNAVSYTVTIFPILLGMASVEDCIQCPAGSYCQVAGKYIISDRIREHTA